MMPDPTYVREEIDRDPKWKIAFILSELNNDDAPIGWGKYIPFAENAIEAARTFAREEYSK